MDGHHTQVARRFERRTGHDRQRIGSRGELRRDDEIIRITEREREILTILGHRPSHNVPREELAGGGSGANERTVDVQINRLRRKIERDPADPLYLQTVRGIGYRLVTDRA